MFKKFLLKKVGLQIFWTMYKFRMVKLKVEFVPMFTSYINYTYILQYTAKEVLMVTREQAIYTRMCTCTSVVLCRE